MWVYKFEISLNDYSLLTPRERTLVKTPPFLDVSEYGFMSEYTAIKKYLVP